MAIAFDAAAAGFTTSTSSHTQSLTVSGTDRVLIVGTVSNGNAITGVTYNSVAMTELDSNINFAGSLDHQIWYLIAPDTGTNNIVASTSGSQNIFVTAASYTGVSQTGFPDNNNNNTVGSIDEYNTSLTPTVDDCWVVLAACGGSRIRVKDDGTSRANDNVVSMISDNNAAVNPAASTQLDSERFSSGTTQRSHFMVSIAPVGVASTFIPKTVAY